MAKSLEYYRKLPTSYDLLVYSPILAKWAKAKYPPQTQQLAFIQPIHLSKLVPTPAFDFPLYPIVSHHILFEYYHVLYVSLYPFLLCSVPFIYIIYNNIYIYIYIYLLYYILYYIP